MSQIYSHEAYQTFAFSNKIAFETSEPIPSEAPKS